MSRIVHVLSLHARAHPTKSPSPLWSQNGPRRRVYIPFGPFDTPRQIINTFELSNTLAYDTSKVLWKYAIEEKVQRLPYNHFLITKSRNYDYLQPVINLHPS
ncbi:hypothetical protein Fot_31344 [Forsythia ovata]|uniref:Ribosomal protein S10 n=1 Tax=Forsythia ovata TaxID=205694 RepID=A0ABD1T4T0_9LAMI